MKKYLLFLLVILTASGCGGEAKKKAVLAKIGNYEITKDKFEEEFRESIYGSVDTLEARKEFLANLINRKLILQDAQLRGWDKEKDFLKMIEKFWEQSLLKIALDKKVGEVSGSVSVSEQEIQGLYDTMIKEGKTDKPYGEMSNDLRRYIVKSKESQVINEWITQMHKDTRIEINDKLLNEK